MRTLFKNCTVISHEGAIRNGYLGVDGDTICLVSHDRPSEDYDIEKDMSGKILMPGLINAHTHTPMTLLRGIGSGLPLNDWLFGAIFPLEDKLTREDIRVGSELALLEMISSGTTSFSDMYMEPAETVEVALASGIKANICRPVQCFAPEERPEENSRVKESIALYNAYNGAGDGRILIDFSIHAEYTCTVPVTRYYSSLCREYGGNMHIHLSETKKEHDECVSKYGLTPTEWFESLGAFDSRAFAAHCVWVTDHDMTILSNHGVSVVHNPSSNMKLGSGFAPVRKMIDRGLNVALGTDGAASNNNLNMFEELHIASIIHNGALLDPTAIFPSEALNMATVNGAKLQGRKNTGVLKPGFKADIIALDADRPHIVPDNDTISAVCYSAQGSDVVMTMVDGKTLFENGEFLTLDRDRILFDARKTAAKLRTA